MNLADPHGAAQTFKANWWVSLESYDLSDLVRPLRATRKVLFALENHALGMVGDILW